MLKVFRIRPCENNKSCSIFHHESNKIGFAFSDFSTIFYAIYKKQQNHFTIGVTLLQGGPRKEVWLCNVAPGVPGSGGPAKFRPTAGRGRPGTGGGGALGPRGPIPVLVWGREDSSEGWNRRPGTVAIAAGILAAWARCRGPGAVGELG
jgi:hypothetical protein